jgi:hypothetical protein
MNDISKSGRIARWFQESQLYMSCAVFQTPAEVGAANERKGQMPKASIHLLLAGERTASHKGGGEGVCAAAWVSVPGGERKDAAGRARLLPRARAKGGPRCICSRVVLYKGQVASLGFKCSRLKLHQTGLPVLPFQESMKVCLYACRERSPEHGHLLLVLTCRLSILVVAVLLCVFASRLFKSAAANDS